jgi:hypothetical protein
MTVASQPTIETTTLHARIAHVPPAFLQRVRTEGIDDLGQPVRRVVAKGGEPCRDALRRAEPGEELILASFTPFTVAGPYHEYGPVFVFANDAGAAPADSLPIGAPTDYLREQFVIRAYSANEEILDAALVGPSAAQETVARFFARPEVAFLHVRFPTYGCFAVRLERPE